MKAVIMFIVIMIIVGCDNATAIRDYSDVSIANDADQPQINDGVVSPDNTQPDVEIPDGAPAYEIDNGTVISQVTGLRWQRSQSPMSLSYEQSVSYCDNLVLNNITNWRLPTILEIRSIIYNCPSNMAEGSCKATNECNNLNCMSGCNKCNGIDANNPALDRRVWDVDKNIPRNEYQLYTSTKVFDTNCPEPFDVGAWALSVLTGELSVGPSLAYAKCVK